MVGIMKGNYMHTNKLSGWDDIVWKFPEGFEGVKDDVYYQVVYDCTSIMTPSGALITYNVSYCVPISNQTVMAHNIAEAYKNTTDIKDFERWLYNNYYIEEKV